LKKAATKKGVKVVEKKDNSSGKERYV